VIVHLNDEAFKKAADEMEALKIRNEKLRDKLEEMYKDLTEALDTPAGHAIAWQGKELLLQPIDDMSKVIQHVSEDLNMIIGRSEKGVYYDKVFSEYEVLDTIIKNKSTI